MKRVILSFFALFCIVSSSKSETDFVNFELWNKHERTFYYATSNSLQEVITKQPTAIKEGKWVSKSLDTSRPSYLLLTEEMPKPGSLVTVYQFAPFKDMYVRIALPPEEKITKYLKKIFGKKHFEEQNYIFGPQTGPLLGARNITERGHSLSNNVTYKDINRLIFMWVGPQK
ncbi:hypothetical protein Noda2021_11910 [Candidatus Dependentiae bacterium Noda2021]|nr:hypothetical protein Noda2021_11910 [Candidatus Dependentiae bacterium Noda2021]